jgi:hypothetical protein
MKKIITSGVLFLALGATWGMAQQPPQKEERSGMREMMLDMMKEGEGEKSRRGMMRMMKMMDQCSRMMESSHGSEELKESGKK